jgi:methionyl-tRNA synthetase
VRTGFYTVQKYNGGKIPVTSISAQVKNDINETIAKYERTMMRFSFHELMNVLDTFLRDINKHWTTNIKTMEGDFENDAALRQALADNFHMIRIATVLLHPVAPKGTELIFEYLNLSDNSFFSWNRIDEPLYSFMKEPANHVIKELPPRFDFFPKHPSQFN